MELFLKYFVEKIYRKEQKNISIYRVNISIVCHKSACLSLKNSKQIFIFNVFGIYGLILDDYIAVEGGIDVNFKLL